MGGDKAAKKPENSRWNLLLILNVLKRYTDSENPMSAMDICGKINRDFHEFVSGRGQKVMSADTVKRTLDGFISDFFDIYALDTLDFKVDCVMKRGEEYVRYDYGDESLKRMKKYYYYEGEFTTSEIRTLIDAIETHSYFSNEDVCGIVEKLMHLRPCDYRNRRYQDSAEEIRDENSLLLMNIDMLGEIIEKGQRARIEYCYYDENKKLVPRLGYPKEVEPLTLMWSNGYYYMLAYNEKYGNVVNYRVDRIRGIEPAGLGKESVSPYAGKEINPVKYRMEHPVMYGGKKQHFVLLCRDTGRNYVVNMIMDVFGKNTKIVRADDRLLKERFGYGREYYEKQGIKWLKVSFDSAPGGVELWATQYCTDCIIISPESSRQEVARRLDEGRKNYG